MKVKILKNYQHKTSKFVKGTEPDVDRQTGKMLIKKGIAREFGNNVIDKLVIKSRKHIKKVGTKIKK